MLLGRSDTHSSPRQEIIASSSSTPPNVEIVTESVVKQVDGSDGQEQVQQVGEKEFYIRARRW